MTGQTISHYRILDKLGEGGMGIVYKAEDTKLRRTVALKFLPPHALENRERFLREAQAAAALNHTNICTIFEVDEERGFLAMEFIDGVSVKDKIGARPLLLEEALDIAMQACAGLQAAHEKGIVHRDIKSANLMLTPQGQVKIMDFGLAQVGDRTRITKTGFSLGTPAYMSPEQAKGDAVDRRTDIWSLGVVLYEILAGRLPFRGDTEQAVSYGIVHAEPEPLTALRTGLPVELDRVVAKALAKNPASRYQHIEDLLVDLRASNLVAPGRARNPLPTATRPLPWMAATALLALALGISVWAPWRSTRAVDRPLIRLNVDLGPEALANVSLTTAISPDGTRLVFVTRGPDGRPQLSMRPLDELEAMPLAGTGNASGPFFSSDGQWVGFFAEGKLKKISVHGGAAVTVCERCAGTGATWVGDEIVFGGALSGLTRVPAAGGTGRPLTHPTDKGDATHRWPQTLPGHKAILFTAHKIVTGFDDASIEALVMATEERKTILKGGYFGRYLPTSERSGHLVYVHDGVLLGVPFDPGALEVRGSPAPLVDQVAGNPATAAGYFDFSETGTFVYRSGKAVIPRWPVVWLESSGKTEPLIAEPGLYYTPALSPDGKRLALAVDRGTAGRDIAVYDLQTGTLTRLTFKAPVNWFPVWSPDGKYITFESSSDSGFGIGLVRSDGYGDVHRLIESKGLLIPASFSPDGRHLAYFTATKENAFDIWTAIFDTSDAAHPKLREPEPFLSTPLSESAPSFSPDGRWIAHTAVESGTLEVYVRPFPGPGGKWRISTGGGGNGTWSRNGRELFFRSPKGIMVTEYTAQGDSFLAGKPRLWSDRQFHTTPYGREFSLAPDGKRFAVLEKPEPIPEEKGSVHVTFLLNFFDEVRRRIPAGSK